jgi:hypothetical protein
MLIRRFQRGISVVAIAACAPMVFGCSTTTRFVVESDLTPAVVIEAVDTSGQKTSRFDAAGGFIDPAARTVTGKTSDGDPVIVPLAKVQRLYLRDGENPNEPIEADPAALIDGAGWRPDGEVWEVTLRSGEVVDTSQGQTVLDPEKRILRLRRFNGPTSEIPFGEIRYLQIKVDNNGRTGLCVLGGVILCLALGAVIALSDLEFGSSQAP